MEIENNLLADIKKKYLQTLVGFYEKNEAEQILTLLIEHFFRISRFQLIINPNIRISESEILKLHLAVKDLKKYRPVQYIIGEVDFHDLKLKVNSNVLIPRPETEELVQIISNIENAGGLKVLDIGTGSGCIAIAMSKLLNLPTIHACDISQPAIDLAQENAIINNTKVQFHNHDILDDNKLICDKDGNLILFDIIISNPPYVTESDKSKMRANVMNYEPHSALFVSDDNPIIYYSAIIQFAKKQLIPQGKIYFEINESLGNMLVTTLEKNNFINIKLIKDLNDKDRFISTQLPLVLHQ